MGKQNRRIRSACLGVTLFVSGTACMNKLEDPSAQFSVDGKGESTKELPWGPSDDPSVFSDDLKYKFD